MSGRLACACALFSLAATLSTASAERATSDIPDTSRPLLPDSILVSPRANWRLPSLQPEIRRRIHLTATKVPRFPHEDPRLMDPRKWSKVTFIGGAMLWRKIEYLEHDLVREASSMNGVPPGFCYTLRYGDDRGPMYTWSTSGALAERFWSGGGRHSPETFAYIYYPSGELMLFRYRSNGYNRQTDQRKPGECLEEVFARNGTLLGCGYVARCGSDKQAFLGYWLGEEVSYRELQEMEFQVKRSAYRRAAQAQRPGGHR